MHIWKFSVYILVSYILQMRQLIKGRAESAMCDVKGSDLTATVQYFLVGDSEVTNCIDYKSKERMLEYLFVPDKSRISVCRKGNHGEINSGGILTHSP